MPPFGGETRHGFVLSDEPREHPGHLPRRRGHGRGRRGVRPDDLAVLAVVERQQGEVGDLPEQDWSLRVTLAFRREGRGAWCTGTPTRSCTPSAGTQARPRWPAAESRELRRSAGKQAAHHPQPDRQPGQVGCSSAQISSSVAAARRHQPSSPSSQSAIRAGAGSSGDGAAQHLGGELRRARRAGRRAARPGPSSASGRRAAAPGSAAPAPAARAARRARSAPGPPRAGRAPSRWAVSTMPSSMYAGGSTATRRRGPRAPRAAQQLAAAPRTPRARGPVIRSGSCAIDLLDRSAEELDGGLGCPSAGAGC